MNYLKKLGLIALAAAAMSVLADGTASATELTCSTGMCLTGTTVHAYNESTIIFHPQLGDVECAVSTLKGKTSNTGSSTETVSVNVESFEFSGCNAVVNVIKTGSLQFHTRTTSADNNGTLTSNGLTITLEYLGFHCLLKTENNLVGTVTGSSTTGGTATVDVEGKIPVEPGGRSGAFCGDFLVWTGLYEFRSPDFLNVD